MSIHGYSTKDETIVALRLVKDFIIERGGIKEIKVTQELLRSCEKARERYGVFLEQQRKVEEQMKQARVNEGLAKQTKDAVSEVESETRFLKKGIEVAEMSVEEGNYELGEAMKGKTFNRDKIVLCQSKITMGLKRKTELNEDFSKLEVGKENETLYPIDSFVFYCFMITCCAFGAIKFYQLGVKCNFPVYLTSCIK